VTFAHLLMQRPHGQNSLEAKQRQAASHRCGAKPENPSLIWHLRVTP